MVTLGTNYAAHLADQNVISELRRAVDRGVEIRIVVGPMAYIAIHNDSAAKAAYRALIERGARVTYSPYAAPGEIMGLFDDKSALMSTDGGINAMESQHPFDIAHVRSRMGRESERALPLIDFESTIEELVVMYSRFFA